MLSFREVLVEDKSGKNVHLNHLEDSPFIDGINGTRDSIYFLQSLRDMLSSKTPKRPVTITTKWDGAPAIIAGINPENGKFFVGTKGVFAQNAKLNYTDADIDKNHPGEGLNVKLKYALRYLKPLGFKPDRILQGDMMFTAPDLSTKTLGGEKCITFQPNTIMYAVPLDSHLGQQIKNAKMGIIWHTEYKGDTIADMKAYFNPHIGGLHQSKDVWHRDATFTDASGAATFTESETEEITAILSEVGTLFRSLSAPVINKLATNSELTIPLQTFNNSKVRQGEPINNTAKHTAEFIAWIEDKYNAEIAKLKKPEAKKNRETIKNHVVSFFRTNKNQIKIALDLHNLLAKAKGMIVAKLNNVRDIGTFLQTPNGFEVTAPEGFVAISHEGNATKLVDRLTFSHANFTATKNWTK